MQSRTAASDTSAPETAFTHEQRCSLRSVSGSLLPPPTTREETIRALRSYEMDYMTGSTEQSADQKTGGSPAQDSRPQLSTDRES
jgi:hypothetical protein